MCSVSFIGTGWRDTAPPNYPNVWPTVINPNLTPGSDDVTRAEFEALRHEMQELKTLLLAAKRFDRETGQPDCEMDEKVEIIRRVADLVGVDLEDIFSE